MDTSSSSNSLCNPSAPTTFRDRDPDTLAHVESVAGTLNDLRKIPYAIYGDETLDAIAVVSYSEGGTRHDVSAHIAQWFPQYHGQYIQGTFAKTTNASSGPRVRRTRAVHGTLSILTTHLRTWVVACSDSATDRG